MQIKIIKRDGTVISGSFTSENRFYALDCRFSSIELYDPSNKVYERGYALVVGQAGGSDVDCTEWGGWRRDMNPSACAGERKYFLLELVFEDGVAWESYLDWIEDTVDIIEVDGTVIFKGAHFGEEPEIADPGGPKHLAYLEYDESDGKVKDVAEIEPYDDSDGDGDFAPEPFSYP